MTGRDPGAEYDDGPVFPDEAETPEQDLWFLPAPFELDDLPPDAPPAPAPDRRAIFDPAEWRAAQQGLSGELASLAQVFGELDARLRGGSDGLRLRLALNEVADLTWWAGDRFPVERLGLWVALRIGSTEANEGAIARAGWAVRKLTSNAAQSDGPASILDRRSEEATADLFGVMADMDTLHPATQSAVLFHAWRLLGPENARDLEAAVLAARHGALMSRLPGQGAPFLPLATTGPGALRGQGDAQARLSAWLAGAEQACIAALLTLDRLHDWRVRADAAIGDLSGRVPALLLDVLEDWPMVPASLAETQTGASRAAVQRNLDRLSERGLVREITGQGRFRVWTARL